MEPGLRRMATLSDEETVKTIFDPFWKRCLFLKEYYKNTISVSNSFGSDLDPNCLQRLSQQMTKVATSGERVKA